MGLGGEIGECSSQLAETATVGLIGEECFLLRVAGVDDRLGALGAVLRGIETGEHLLEGFQGADDGGCAEIVLGGGGERSREEFQLVDVEMAKALAEGEGSGAAQIGEFTLKAVGVSYRRQKMGRMELPNSVSTSLGACCNDCFAVLAKGLEVPGEGKMVPVTFIG